MTGAVAAPLARSRDYGPLDLALVVRGLAAYQVLVWHTIGSQLHHGLWALINVSGTQCVWLFFAVSGYLVSWGFESGRYQLRRRDLLDYTLARTLRIVPLYALAAVLTYVVLTRLPFVPGDAVDQRRLWTTLLFLQPGTTIPSQFWTLVLEIRFYLALPLFVYLNRRLALGPGTRIGAYALLALVPSVRYLFGIDGLDDRTFTGNASHFVAGMLVHDAWSYVRGRNYFERPGALRTLVIVAVASLVIPTAIYHRHSGLFWPIGSVLTDVAAVAILLLHKRSEERPHRMGVTLWLLSLLGTVAYGVYVWHSALLTVMPQLVHHLATVTFFTLGLSALSFRLYEMPALALRHRLIHRRFIGIPGAGPSAIAVPAL